MKHALHIAQYIMGLSTVQCTFMNYIVVSYQLLESKLLESNFFYELYRSKLPIAIKLLESNFL